MMEYIVAQCPNCGTWRSIGINDYQKGKFKCFMSNCQKTAKIISAKGGTKLNTHGIGKSWNCIQASVLVKHLNGLRGQDDNSEF